MGRPAELSDFQLTAEKAKDYTDSKIDAIQIGGRNYLFDSERRVYDITDAHTSKFIFTRFTLTRDHLSDVFEESKANVGDYFIVSFTLLVSYDTVLENSNVEINFSSNATPWRPALPQHFYPESGLRYDISLPIQLTEADLASTATQYIFSIINSVACTVTISHIKLEKGNKPTDWSPALEEFAMQNEISDLKAYIGYTDNDIYGLEADFENNKFTRLAGAVGKNAGADFDSVHAFGGRRRCAVANDGTVVAYYGDDNYEEDGILGTIIAQVMVEQPKFYYKVVPLKTEKIDGADGYHLRKARYYISDTPKAGFKVHPAFVQNGIEVERIYLSAYEGNIRDDTGSQHKYLWNDEQIADFSGDKLSSVANATPASGRTQALTRANARKLAQNRGAGWGITTIQTLSATQLLFMIEYATFNSQTAIGNGVVNATEPIETGTTSSLGNASGSVTSGGVSYRGEENLWGNIFAYVDGCNSHVESSSSTYGEIYIADHDFTDDTNESPYEYTGIKACVANGDYISAFGYSEKYDWLFIPTEHQGNSALPIGDAQYNIPYGWGVSAFGGRCSDGLKSGLFNGSLSNRITTHQWFIGARLVYIHQPETAIQEVDSND